MRRALCRNSVPNARDGSLQERGSRTRSPIQSRSRQQLLVEPASRVVEGLCSELRVQGVIRSRCWAPVSDPCSGGGKNIRTGEAAPIGSRRSPARATNPGRATTPVLGASCRSSSSSHSLPPARGTTTRTELYHILLNLLVLLVGRTFTSSRPTRTDNVFRPTVQGLVRRSARRSGLYLFSRPGPRDSER